MRSDLERMENILKKVKNPPKEYAAARSTTAVDLNLPTEGITINPKIAANIKAQEAAKIKEQKANTVIDQQVSDLYKSGGSTLPGFEELTTDQKRTAFINKDPNYLYYSTKKGS